MTNKAFCVLAALLLSGCSNDWSAGLANERHNSTSAASIESASPAGADSSPMRARAGRSFAGAPDRGSLVQYPKDPVVRRSGAYTWHAADLSEDHALRSTITGNLSFTAPDGTPISLAYQRHVEHPDGNWSWIGRAKGERGESTVITFGEEAAFGTIPQGRDQPPLRLTIADGRAWVVSADPRLLREIRNEATHPTDQDFLVPPKLAASTATALGGMEAMGAEAMATTATGKTVVDVLVGFTDGYSTYRGGASAAITRIHNLVEVTNQAYRNSQVNAEVRLVHSMQVSYPDATANKAALEELTGFNAPSTRTTPAPAFSALRSARNQYGADVVVLLRQFQDPENDGCGIAWLIGGGRSGIDPSDEFFGYSVVGDGQDVGTDGKTYFCRDETLAHEIGHNIGSQHDADNAKKDDGSVSYGAYSYSFGYRTTAGAGDFYTVMAYGDTGQTRNRVFSNPDVSICGKDQNLVCGVSGQSDNARSLNNLVATVATFRGTVVPHPAPLSFPELIDARSYDINGDGNSDLLWRLGTKTDWAYWTMAGATRAGGGGAYQVGPEWNVVATGDFHGDGQLDLVWTDGFSMQMWSGADNSFAGDRMRSYPVGYRVVAVGDVNNDGFSDLVWRDNANSLISIWLMKGPTVIGGLAYSVGASWRIVGTGDLTGDGLMDIIWTDGSTMQLWKGAANGFVGAAMSAYPAGWDLVGIGDVDGDGSDDLLWRHQFSGEIAYWRMSGPSRIHGMGFAASKAWKILQVADFTGDGKVDIVWTDDQAMQMWTSTGSGFVGAQMPAYPVGWVHLRR